MAANTNGTGTAELIQTNGSTTPEKSTWRNKVGLAEMLKGGVIMDVINAEQAVIAEEAGAVAVMALERVPADIRKHGGVARMSDPKMIQDIMKAVTIPVMAKARIGHFVEAQILEALGVDFIDESKFSPPPTSSSTSTSTRSRRRSCAAAVTWARRCANRRGRGHDSHQGRGRHRATSSRRCAICGPSTPPSAASRRWTRPN
jgi:hypothetical protein